MPLKSTPRPHQVEALAQWRKRPGRGFAFFMEQRTGKTFTALMAVNEVKPSRLIVICPKRAVKEWTGQIPEHLINDWGMQVKIVTFGVCANNRQQLRRWLKDGMAIVDESHRIKSPSSKYSMGARFVGRHASERLILTGTPIAQGIHDVWAQFNFLDEKIFGKWSDFKDRYCLMGGFKGKKVVGSNPDTLDEFSELFHRHSFRVTLREVQQARLKIRHAVHRCKLGTEWTPYRELEEELVTLVNDSVIETPLVITQSIKLQQVTGGFVLDEEGNALEVGTTKLRQLEELWGAIEDEHVIISYRFDHERSAIAQLARRLGLSIQTINGAGNDYDRENPADWVLLQIQSGIAIDISSASSIIFYSWDFSFLNYEQLKSRVLFYNVERATYHYLVAGGTIDELILKAVRSKKRFADLVCDHWRESP